MHVHDSLLNRIGPATNASPPRNSSHGYLLQHAYGAARGAVRVQALRMPRLADVARVDMRARPLDVGPDPDPVFLPLATRLEIPMRLGGLGLSLLRLEEVAHVHGTARARDVCVGG